MLFLAASLLCAFFLPDYYSRWQDEQLLHQVHVEDRQMTHLPEEKEKPVAEKIRKMTESWEFTQVARYDLAEGASAAADLEWQEKLDQQVGEWIRFGLLPEAFLETFESCELQKVNFYTCFGSGLNVLWMRYEKEGTFLDFVMDTDGVCLYYVAYNTAREQDSRNPSRKDQIQKREGERDWVEQTIADRVEGEESFLLREYCQADYVQRTGNNDSFFYPYIGSNDFGSVTLLYKDFSAGAITFGLDLFRIEEPARYEGSAILLGSGSLLELVLDANWQDGWECGIKSGIHYFDGTDAETWKR